MKSAEKKDGSEQGEHLPSLGNHSHIDNIKGLLELLPDELSESESVDMDKEEEEQKQDTAPTRKSKKNMNNNLNRQQTKEFNQLIKDS